MKTPLKVALVGYGKIGKEIEKVILERQHQVVLIIDSEEDWLQRGDRLAEADVVIEFTTPDTAMMNIKRCFNAGVPVVTGTTGWHAWLEEIKKECQLKGGSLFFSPNYSISVNIFFEINKLLARLINPYEDYEVNIEETHHISKIDAPSGTAIALADDIIRFMERKDKWVGQKKRQSDELEIRSVRQENVPGTHLVTYESPQDLIEIRHTAKNRRGFALGAVMAAEWLIGRKGFYEMSDLLNL